MAYLDDLLSEESDQLSLGKKPISFWQLRDEDIMIFPGKYSEIGVKREVGKKKKIAKVVLLLGLILWIAWETYSLSKKLHFEKLT